MGSGPKRLKMPPTDVNAASVVFTDMRDKGVPLSEATYTAGKRDREIGYMHYALSSIYILSTIPHQQVHAIYKQASC